MTERVERERARRRQSGVLQEIRRIRERYLKLPIQDTRSADEILGYDQRGLPG